MAIHVSPQASLQHHRRSLPTGEEDSTQITEEDASFCSRFELPTSEAPFPDWQGGRRCSLVDRERPLMGSKGGRLFLTCSFLCFERSSKARDPDRMVIPLTDITGIVKVSQYFCKQSQRKYYIASRVRENIIASRVRENIIASRVRCSNIHCECLNN